MCSPVFNPVGCIWIDANFALKICDQDHENKPLIITFICGQVDDDRWVRLSCIILFNPDADMSVQLCLLRYALAELFADVSQSGVVTLADRYGLMAAVFEEDQLTDDEKCSVNRLLRSASKGRVQIVNELSTLESQ